MAGDIRNVLFLCTGNSARSILAEAILNKLGGDAFRAYSAGSHPKGAVNPAALKLLDQLGYEVTSFRSKSWDEFAKPGAPVMDYIITVCDQAAGETCPVWPGKPLAGHWGLPDPANVEGSDAEKMTAFREAHDIIEARMRYFLALAPQTLAPKDIKRKLREAGTIQPRRTDAGS